ncbi:MAG: leucine-rich repeat domain-containing protein [Alphaproteobacteria bacterium]|nr:leucine-rich repeat domain-containing protein [Alphaproteobacteria bacterium]
MKRFGFLGLIFSLIFVLVNKARAETWNCGPATDGVYSDSVKCTYDEATKTLTISGEGPMGNYNYVDGRPTTPWRDKNIVHSVIENGVTTIGDHAFEHIKSLQDIVGTENITKIGYASFSGTSLISIDLPNVQEIGGVAFYSTKSLRYAGIPEDVTYDSDSYLNRDTFAGSKLANCRKTGDCGSCGEKFVQSGVGCVSSCYTGYTSYYGFCTRTRYTLPEADAATSDDFENTIEWIFE